METKQKIGLGGAFALPLLAGVIVALTPQAASAMSTCLYAGQAYSVGACIRSVCEAPEAQECLNGGTWGNCNQCTIVPE